MSSLGIFDKETKTYKKVADLSKPAVIDSAMSDTSTNPVQNKVVKSALDGKSDINHAHNYAGSSSEGGDANRAMAIADYGDVSKTINIGFSGQGISGDQIGYIAGYTDNGTKIKDVGRTALIEWIGLGSAVDTLQGEIDNLKKSVSDGKSTVANAITAKGVTTATDATFDVMAENISKIETGGGELHGATISGNTEEEVLFGKDVQLIYG